MANKMLPLATMLDDRKEDLGQFLITLLLGLPALFAFIGSVGLAHGSPYSASGLWFFCLVSRILGYIGIAVAAIFTSFAIFRRTVSEAVACLMALSTAAAIALLWCAARTFPSSMW